MAKKIVVVGAGVGGLACAARLAYKGYSVDVYEKLPRCGGRCHLLEDAGFKFDMGPSFVLMPGFFEEVFSSCGGHLRDFLRLTMLEQNYKIFYPDGDTFTVFADQEQTKAELEKIEKGSSQAYGRFIQATEKIYQSVEPLLYKSFSPQAIFNPAYWPLLVRLQAFRSYWNLARTFFKSEKLCYAFTFEAMFIGVSPFSAPAFYSVITYADHVQKIFHPLGGMYQIPLALERLAGKYGARFFYNTEVERIEQNGSLNIRTTSEKQSADGVVVNADYAYSQRSLLHRAVPRYDYSCSVYLLYLGLKKKVAGCSHHNLFFAKDLRKNLDDIFMTHAVSADPSFYLHVPTVTDPELAPPGKEIFYVLIPVPNLHRDILDIRSYTKTLRSVVFGTINRTFGIRLEELIEVEHEFYPNDFIQRYNIEYGATFGLAHTLFQSAFFRPANRDKAVQNLYYVGASTQPGGGLPVVIASSHIAAGLIEKEIPL